MQSYRPRLFGWSIPIALIIGMLFGKGATTVACELTIFALPSLWLSEAFSRAAARTLSTRKIMGNLILSLLICIVLSVGMLPALGIAADHAMFCAISVLLIAIRCFEELFASQGDRTSAEITTVLTFIATSSGMLIDGILPESTPMFSEMAVGVGGVFLLSGGIALGFSRKERPQLNLGMLKEIPIALLRTLLYPALCAAIAVVIDVIQPQMAFCGACVGWTLLEMAKTPFRRDKSESAGLKIGISTAVLLCSAGNYALQRLGFAETEAFAAFFFAGGSAALMLFGAMEWDSVLAAAVLLAGAALIALNLSTVIAPLAVGIVAFALMLRAWREPIRQIRVSRIRKKAIKQSRLR